MRWDDSGLTFEATLWELLECSLVSVGADAAASIRSMMGGGDHVADVRARMMARQRMHERAARGGL